MEAKQIKTELKELKRPKTPVQIRELYIKRDLNETVKQAKQTLKKNPGNVFSTKAPDMTHNDFARLRINSQLNRKRSFSAEYNFNYKEAHETTRKGTKMIVAMTRVICSNQNSFGENVLVHTRTTLVN
ncbi:Hypothetical_protein [Hexamita inflata]|uniref:Hypothetical_protein n=1 Tax=Hexamita inflata TaxID=28002 RepID=A0AA86PA81_9EUKA|nr:Hypothetical protein HINF_LOCUS22671 [Hexamita inflata]